MRPADLHEEIVALARQGLSSHMIARRLGVSYGGVRNRLRIAGITPDTSAPMVYRRLDARQRDAFARLWMDNRSYEEIAEAIGVSATGPTLARWRKQLGLPSRKGNPRPPKAARGVPFRIRPSGGDACHVGISPRAKGPVHPFWTPERDALVMATHGRYELICDLAERFGRPVRFVLARWHRLRGGGS